VHSYLLGPAVINHKLLRSFCAATLVKVLALIAETLSNGTKRLGELRAQTFSNASKRRRRKKFIQSKNLGKLRAQTFSNAT